jgi:putative tricarboxylic transport membrane protein
MAFGIPKLADGIGFAVVAMGVFGFAEIIATSSSRPRAARTHQQQGHRPDADQGT